MNKKFIIVILYSVVFSSAANAAHIGDRVVTAVRQFTPSYVLVYLDSPINNAPSCSTNSRAIVLDTTGDQDMRNRQFSMLLTSLTLGLKINPNCSQECVHLWTDQYVVKCGDMYLKK